MELTTQPITAPATKAEDPELQRLEASAEETRIAWDAVQREYDALRREMAESRDPRRLLELGELLAAIPRRLAALELEHVQARIRVHDYERHLAEQDRRQLRGATQALDTEAKALQQRRLSIQRLVEKADGRTFTARLHQQRLRRREAELEAGLRGQLPLSDSGARA